MSLKRFSVLLWLQLFLSFSIHSQDAVYLDEQPLSNNKNSFIVTYKEQVSGVSLIDFSGSYDRKLNNIFNVEARQALMQNLYQNVDDGYDFVVVFTTFPVDSENYAAFYTGVMNDTSGIGIELFNNQAAFGSEKLQGIIDMTELADWAWDLTEPSYDVTLDALMHELMHRWGPQITYLDGNQPNQDILGESATHWSYFLNSHASVMYGSHWSEVDDSEFETLDVMHQLSPLDLYLMGMKSASSVPDFFLISNGQPGVSTDLPPAIGAKVTGEKKIISIDDVIAAEGPRVPEFSESQHEFNVHFVVLTRPGQEVSSTDIGKLLILKKQFQQRFLADTAGMGSIIYPEDSLTSGDVQLLSFNPNNFVAYDESEALQFVLDSQTEEGYWQDKQATSIRDTATVLDALSVVNSSLITMPSISWLHANDVVDNDQASWLLLSGMISQAKSNALKAQLISSQNTDGGWGATVGDESNIYDTALVLYALKKTFGSEYLVKNTTFEFLAQVTNEDLGAGYSRSGRSALTATAMLMKAMSLLDGFESQFNTLADYLVAQQTLDGQFGTLNETVIVLDALQLSTAPSHVTAANLSLSYLDTAQSLDRSFAGSVYTTAVAMKLLADDQKPNLRIITTEVASQAVSGEQLSIVTKVINDGVAIDMPSTVGLYHDDVLIDSIEMANWPAGEEHVVSLIFDTSGLEGEQVLTVKADALDEVAENNESDNQYQLPLTVQAVSAIPELVIQVGQSGFQPTAFDALPFALSVDVTVENLSLQNVDNVAVSLFVEDADNNLQLLEEQVVNLPSQQPVLLPFSHDIANAEGDLEFVVIIDYQQAIEEVNENNNQWHFSLSSQPSIDLAISLEGVELPDTFIAGDQHSINFNFSNLGTLPAPYYSLLVSADDGQEITDIYQHDVVTMVAGETLNRQFYWTPQVAGSYQLTFQLDDQDQLAEIDENNNTLQIVVEVAENLLTNLRIDDVLLNPDPGLSGLNNEVQVMVTNDAMTDATGFTINVYEQYSDGTQTLLSSLEVPGGLEAGNTVQHNINLIDAKQIGDTTLIVHVDADEQVNEFNENDNLLIKEFQFLSQPDAMVTPGAITLDPTLPVPGEVLGLAATVVNLGEQPLENLTVDWYTISGSETPVWIGQKNIVALEGGGSVISSLDYEMPIDNQITAFQVIVDLDDQIDEGREHNNQAILNIEQQDLSFYFTDDVFSPNGDGVQDTTEFVFNTEVVDDYSISIYDFRDRLVRHFEQNYWQQTDQGDVVWDGRNDQGELLPDGVYRVTLSGDQNGLIKHLSVTVDTNRTPMMETLLNNNGIHYDLTCLTNSPYLLGAFSADGRYFFTKEYKDKENVLKSGLFKIKTDASEIESIFPAIIDSPTYTQVLINPIADGGILLRSYQGTDQLFKINPETGGYQILNTTGLDEFYLRASYDDFALIEVGGFYYQVSYDPETAPELIVEQGLNYLSRYDQLWSYRVDDLKLVSAVGNFAQSLDVLALLNPEDGEIDWHYDQKTKTLYVYGEQSLLVIKAVNGAAQVINQIDFSDSGLFIPTKSDHFLIVLPGEIQVYRSNGEYLKSIPHDLTYDYFKSRIIAEYGSLENIKIYVDSECVFFGFQTIVSYDDLEDVKIDFFDSTINVASDNEVYIDIYAALEAKVTVPYGDCLIKESFAIGQANGLSPFNGKITFSPAITSLQLESTTIIPPKKLTNAYGYSTNLYESEGHYFSMADDIYLRNESGEPQKFETELWQDYALSKTDKGSPVNDQYLVSTDSLSVGQQCALVGESGLSFYRNKANLTALIEADTNQYGIEFRGSAFDRNFSHYEIWARLISESESPSIQISNSSVPQYDQTLLYWVPDKVGLYEVELRVYDKAGNLSTDSVEVQFDQQNLSIRNFNLSLQYFSPDGDGFRDQVAISYDVLKADNVQINIKNSEGIIVKTMTNSHEAPVDNFIVQWNGLDKNDELLPSGYYTIEINHRVHYVVLDLIPPLGGYDYCHGVTSFSQLTRDYFKDNTIDNFLPAPAPYVIQGSNLETNLLDIVYQYSPLDLNLWEPTGFWHFYDGFSDFFIDNKFRMKATDKAGNYSLTEIQHNFAKIIPYRLRKLSNNAHISEKRLVDSQDTYCKPAIPVYQSNNTVVSDDFLLDKEEEDQYVFLIQSHVKADISEITLNLFADDLPVKSESVDVISSQELSQFFFENEISNANQSLPYGMVELTEGYVFGVKVHNTDFDTSYGNHLMFQYHVDFENNQNFTASFLVEKEVINSGIFYEDQWYGTGFSNRLPRKISDYIEYQNDAFKEQVRVLFNESTNHIDIDSEKRYLINFAIGDSAKTTNNKADVEYENQFVHSQLPSFEKIGSINGMPYRLLVFETEGPSCDNRLLSVIWSGHHESDQLLEQTAEIIPSNGCMSAVTNQKFYVNQQCHSQAPINTHSEFTFSFYSLDNSYLEATFVEVYYLDSDEEKVILWTDTDVEFNLNLSHPKYSNAIVIDHNEFTEGQHVLFVEMHFQNGWTVLQDGKLLISTHKIDPLLTLDNEGGYLCPDLDGKVELTGVALSSQSDGYYMDVILDTPMAGVNPSLLGPSSGDINYNQSNYLFGRESGSLNLPIKTNATPFHRVFDQGDLNYSGWVNVVMETVNTSGVSVCDIKSLYIDLVPQYDLDLNNEDKYISPGNGNVVSLAHLTALEPLDVVLSVVGTGDVIAIELNEGATFEFQWDGKVNDVQVPDGDYFLELLISDGCNNTSSVETAVTVDTESPSYTFQSPVDQQEVPGIFEMQLLIEEPHLDEPSVVVGYRYNGQLHELDYELELLPLNEQEDYLLTAVVNLSNLPLDTYELVIASADLAGNESEQSIFVHRLEPHQMIWSFELEPRYLSPDGDDLYELLNINLGLNKEANVTINVLDDAEQLVVNLLPDSTLSTGMHPYQWSGLDAQDQLVTNGQYLIRASAYDPDDQEIIETVQLSFVVDTIVPQVTLNPSSLVIPGSGPLVAQIIEDNVQSTQFWLQPLTPLSAEYSIHQGAVSGDIELLDLSTLVEGDYQLRTQVRDRAGHTTMLLHGFTIDNTAPVVSWLQPAPEQMIGEGVVTLSVSIEDAHFESGQIDLALDTEAPNWETLVEITELTDQVFTHEWPVTAEDGAYLLRALALDQAGHETPTIQSVIIDRTPPVAEISNPVQQSLQGPVFTVIGTASDANLSQYQLSYRLSGESDADWHLIHSGISAQQDAALLTWDHQLVSGDYQLRLSVFDAAGQQTDAVVDFAIDTDAPGIPSPLTANYQPPNTANLSWGAVDAPDLAGYFVYRSGVLLNDEPTVDTSWVDADLADGVYAYWVVAVDLVGNQSLPSEQQSVTVDTIAPELWLLQPADMSTVSGSINVMGSAMAESDFKVASLFIREINENAPGELIYNTTLPISSQLLATVDTTLLVNDADYLIRWQAEDLTGNIATLEHQITIDNQAPAAPLNLNYQLDANQVELTWTANNESDLSGYLVFRNGQIISGDGSVVSGQVTETIYLDEAVPDGEHEYYVVAVDLAGNVSETSNIVVVNINHRVPDAWFIEPPEGHKFEAPVRLTAISEDTDVAGMLFEFHTGDEQWQLLEDDTEAPFDTLLDPELLQLDYGNLVIRVTARDEANDSDQTPDVKHIIYTDLTPPAAVEGLVAQVNGGDVTLTWDSNEEADLAEYQLLRKQLEPELENDFTLLSTVESSENSYLDNDVADGVYRYRIHAVDDYDNLSNASNSDNTTVWSIELKQPFTPVLGVPDMIFNGSVPQPGTLVFDWQNDLVLDPPSPQIMTEAGTFITSALSLTTGDNILTVVEEDEADHVSKAASKTVQLSPVPPVPVNQQSNLDSFNLTLSWEAPEDDTTGYLPYFNGEPTIDQQRLTEELTFDASSNMFNVANALDADEESYWSPTWTDINNGEPTYYQLNFNSPRWIVGSTINWLPGYDENVAPVSPSHYEIQYLSAVGWLTVAEFIDDQNATVNFQTTVPYLTTAVRIWIPLPEYNYEEISLTEWDITEQPYLTTLAHNQVMSDGIYQLQVSAINSYGFESALTEAEEIIVGDVVPPETVSLSGEVFEQYHVQLNWTASVSEDVDHYRIFRDGMLLTITQDANQLSYQDLNLINGEYSYQVAAVDTAGNQSVLSNEIIVNIEIDLIEAPANLSVHATEEGGVLQLNWDVVNNPFLAYYQIYRSLNPNSDFEPLAQSDNNQWLDHVPYGIRHYYYIISVDNLGNESVASNIADGITFDLEVPPPPIFLTPAEGGEEIEVTDTFVDITGMAGTAQEVSLLLDGIEVAQTQVSDSYQLLEQNLDTELTEIRINANNDWITYYGAGEEPLKLHHLITKETNAVALDVALDDYFWSADGSHLIVIADEGENEVLYRVNLDGSHQAYGFSSDLIDVVSMSPDEQQLVYTGNGYNEQLQDITYGFWHYDLNTQDVTLIPVEGNVLIQRESIQWINDSTIVFINHPTYIYNPGELLRYALNDESAEVLDNETASTATLSMDTVQNYVYYDDDLGNNQNVITRLSLDDLSTVQLANNQYDFSKPVVSDDADVIMAYWGTQDLVLVNFNSGEILAHFESAGNGLQVLKAQDGVYKAVKNNNLLTFMPPGYFTFNNWPLNAGVNEFTAIGIKENGLLSDPSEPIWINLLTASLPDLLTRDEYLNISPHSLSVNDQASGVLVLTNNSQVPVNDVIIDANLVYPDLSQVPILNSPMVMDLDAGEVVSLNFTLNDLNQPGEYHIQASLDPAQQITEINENNNVAGRSFWVLNEKNPYLTVNLAEHHLYTNDHIDATLAVYNPSASFSGSVVVTLTDSEDFPTGLVQSFVITDLPTEGYWENVINWPVADLYAGDYLLKVQLLDQSDMEISQRIHEVTVHSFVAVDLVAGIGSSPYLTGEEMNFSATLEYLHGNEVIEGLLQWTVVNDLDQIIWQYQQQIGQLTVGETAQYAQFWLMPAPGNYRLQLQLLGYTTMKQLPFTVEALSPQVQLQGEVLLTPAVLDISVEETVDYQLNNTGDVDLTNVPVKLVLFDEGMTQPLLQQQFTSDLNVGQQLTDSVDFDTSLLAVDRYVLVLSADLSNYGSEWVTLDHQLVELADTLPPIITALKPADQGVYASPVLARAEVIDQASDINLVTVQVDEGDVIAMQTVLASSVYESLLVGLNEGDHQLSWQASDTAGNLAVINTSVTIDNTPPEIMITGVDEGQVYAQPMAVDVLVNDLHLGKVYIILNGQPYQPQTMITEEGSYLLMVSATDQAGHTSTAQRQFTIDLSPPEVVITYPLNNSSTTQDHTVVSGETEAGATVYLMVNDQNWQTQADYSGEFMFTEIPLNMGANTLTLHAIDIAGNIGPNAQSTVNRVSSLQFTGQLLAPTSAALGQSVEGTLIVSNQSEQKVIQLPIRLRLNAMDDTLLWSEDYLIDIAGDSDYQQAWQFQTEQLTAANKRLSLWVWQNDHWLLLTEQLIELIDQTPPNIIIQTPEIGLTYGPELTFSLTVSDSYSDLGAVSYQLPDMQDWQDMAFDGQHHLADVELTHGSHQVRFRAIDAVGNEAVTEMIAFQVDAMAPEITIAHPSNGLVTNQDVNIDYQTTDPHPGSDQVTLNGQQINNGYVVSDEGDYQLVVHATDAYQNGSTLDHQFIIDKTAPMISIASPDFGAQYQVPQFDLAGSIGEAGTVYLQFSDDLLQQYSIKTNNAGEFSFIGLSLDPGINHLTIGATDQAGNVAETIEWQVEYVSYGIVSGSIWHDQNGNGNHDPDENTLTAVAVALQANNNGSDYAAVTDSQGHFELPQVVPGDYQLVLSDPVYSNEWQITTNNYPASIEVLENQQYDVQWGLDRSDPQLTTEINAAYGVGRLLVLVDPMTASYNANSCQGMTAWRAQTPFASQSPGITSVSLVNEQNQVLQTEQFQWSDWTGQANQLIDDQPASHRVNLLIHAPAHGYLSASVVAEGSQVLNKNLRLELSQGNQLVSSIEIPANCNQWLQLGEYQGDWQLIDVDLYPAVASDDPDSDSDAPLVAEQRLLLNRLLTEQGWSYELTDDLSVFESAVESGEYVAYLMLADQSSLSNDLITVINHQVKLGDGLFISSQDQQLATQIQHMLGVAVSGLQQASMVQVTNGQLITPGQAILAHHEPVLKMQLDGGEEVAVFTSLWSMEPDNQAMTTRQLQLGQMILAGFDILLQASSYQGSAGYYQWLVDGISAVIRTGQAVESGKARLVELTLHNMVQATSGHVQVVLPEGVSLAYSDQQTMTDPQGFIFDYSLPQGESGTYGFWLVVNQSPATVAFNVYATGYGDAVFAQDEVTLEIGSIPDLSGLITNCQSAVRPDQSLSYQFHIRNLGNQDIVDALASVSFNEALMPSDWSCAGTGGATCAIANGIGSIDGQSMNLPTGSEVTFNINAQVVGMLGAQAAVSAQIDLPEGVVDLDLTNNQGDDYDDITAFVFKNGFECAAPGQPKGSM